MIINTKEENTGIIDAEEKNKEEIKETAEIPEVSANPDDEKAKPEEAKAEEKSSVDEEEKPEEESLKEDEKDSIPDAMRCLMEHLKETVGNNQEEQEGDVLSSIDKLRQAEENWGMRFSGSSFQNPTFIINQGVSSAEKVKPQCENLFLKADDSKILEWCAGHYRDFYFSFFLAMCILDRQPYVQIHALAQELKETFRRPKEGSSEESGTIEESVYKSQLIEILGITEYQDVTFVRGEKVESDFVRLPSHDQAGYYIRLVIKEFSELKTLLGNYLINKVITVYKSRGDYIVIGGYSEALINIAVVDLNYFNEVIIHGFLKECSTGTDYCLANLLKRLYQLKEYRRVVVNCITQLAKLRNNPHFPLTALYLCGMVGGQELFVNAVWVVVIEEILKEVTGKKVSSKYQYTDMLREFFISGNRDSSYYKGVIHAFYNHLHNAIKTRNREAERLIGSVFLMVLIDDFSRFKLSGQKGNKQDMLWVSIFSFLNEDTEKELSCLWAAALKSRQYPKEGWSVLEKYLSELDCYDEKTAERLIRFFYCINKEYGTERIYIFLMQCAARSSSVRPIAEDICKRMKKENTNG